MLLILMYYIVQCPWMCIRIHLAVAKDDASCTGEMKCIKILISIDFFSYLTAGMKSLH